MMNTCKIYKLTGNCPERESCKRDHPEPSKETTNNPPPKKSRLKLGGTFIPKSNLHPTEESKISTTGEVKDAKQAQVFLQSEKNGSNEGQEKLDPKNMTQGTVSIKMKGKLRLNNQTFEVSEKSDNPNLKEFLASEDQKEFQVEKEFYSNEEDEEELYDDYGDMEDDEEPQGAFWNDGGNKLVYVERDPEFFYEKSENCSCCKGHIYNCDGEICQNLDACFCYELE